MGRAGVFPLDWGTRKLTDAPGVKKSNRGSKVKGVVMVGAEEGGLEGERCGGEIRPGAKAKKPELQNPKENNIKKTGRTDTSAKAGKKKENAKISEKNKKRGREKEIETFCESGEVRNWSVSYFAGL